MVKNDKVQIPLELISYVLENKLVTAFKVYMYLKCSTSGKIHQNDAIISQMGLFLDIKDRRTLRKHLEVLMALNWVGYNQESGYYFIRSISSLRKQLGIKKRNAATFHFKDLNNFHAFLAGSLISGAINSQKYYWKVVKNRLS